MRHDEITAYLHAHIPITQALGARVESWDGSAIRLSAPLAPNLNHRGTAFGGSLSALAILAGWAILHLALRERGLEVRLVIQRSALDFVEPIEGDFTASARLPPPAQWERFLATLSRHSRARITVEGEVACGGRAGGRHEGVYVALRGAEPG